MVNKKKLIIFTAFVTVVVAVFCAFVIKRTGTQTLTVTDKDGVTYVAVIDQNSEVYAGITDKNGTMYAAEIENGVVKKDSPLYVVGDYTGTFPNNDTTRTDDISIEQNNDDDVDFSGEAQTKATTENEQPDASKKKGKKKKKKGTDSGEKKPEDYKAYKFSELFKSGIFAMTFTTNDPDMSQDITIAMRNGSIYMDTSMEGIACKMIYDANKKEGHMIIPQMKIYLALPEDLSQELSEEDIDFPDITEAIRGEVYDVTIDGKDCVCEEFEFSDGKTQSFYFYNDKLIRMVIITQGDTSIYNIKSITSEVDNSYFELPKGYVKVDLSWLEAQAEKQS